MISVKYYALILLCRSFLESLEVPRSCGPIVAVWCCSYYDNIILSLLLFGIFLIKWPLMRSRRCVVHLEEGFPLAVCYRYCSCVTVWNTVGSQQHVVMCLKCRLFITFTITCWSHDGGVALVRVLSSSSTCESVRPQQPVELLQRFQSAWRHWRHF